MRRRITLLAALVVLGGCSQKDQDLPFEPQPNEPVTSTMGSGNTTVSTPDGISLTVPAGALPAGTPITVVKLERPVGEELPGAVGDAYLVGFDGVPTSDPSITFSLTLGQDATAGQLVGMVPVVLRVGSAETAPAGNLTTSRFVSRQGVRADVSSTSAQERLEALLQAGILNGLNGSATTQNDITRQQFGDLIRQLQDLDTTSPSTPPLFTDPGDGWNLQAITQAAVAGLLSTIDTHTFSASFANMLSVFDLPQSLNPAAAGIYGQYLSNGGSVFMITNFLPSILATHAITALPPNDTASNPLIPASSSSASFTLLCTGIQWPGSNDVPTCSENTIDVRVGSELLSRFPISVVVPNYLLAEMTLGADGSATGQVEYETYLRSALSSGITGVGRKGSFDLDGSWSVNGDTITIGGHDFLYTVPDSESLILSVSDSVKLENNDGTDSWQPVKVNVKLARQQ